MLPSLLLTIWDTQSGTIVTVLITSSQNSFYRYSSSGVKCSLLVLLPSVHLSLLLDIIFSGSHPLFTHGPCTSCGLSSTSLPSPSSPTLAPSGVQYVTQTTPWNPLSFPHHRIGSKISTCPNQF